MRVAPIFVLPMLAWASAVFAQDAGGAGARPPLALDATAPEISATNLDGKGVTLADLRAANVGKVMVLQFGSLTDPVFRAHVATVEKNAAKTNDKACYVIIYQKEAHPASDPLELNVSAGFNEAEPKTLANRQALARKAMEQLHITSQTMLVDAMNNATSWRYGSLPNMTFVLDSKGVMRGAYPFMDPAKVDAAVGALAGGAGGKTLPEELRGAILASSPGVFDFSGAAADMTGGRGPAAIAGALESATLSDAQKQNLLKGIAEFMAEAQDFRTLRASVPAAPARAGAATRGAAAARGNPPAAVAAGAGSATKPMATAEDVQAAQVKLKATADRLKVVVRQNMNAKDGAALLAALDSLFPALRLFSN